MVGKVMFRKELLDKGLKWMICNGEEILVQVTPQIDDKKHFHRSEYEGISVD